MKKSMFFTAIIAIVLLSSCTQTVTTLPQQPKEVEVTVLYEEGDQFTPEHHSKHQVTGKNCEGKKITYNRYEENGSPCPKTEIGKPHYFMSTPAVSETVVVPTNYWSGFPTLDGSIWPWLAIIGLILLVAYLWNNRNRSHIHTHEHNYPINSGAHARSDFHNRPGCHQDNDNARNSWFNGSIPNAYPNIEEEVINLSVTRRYPQTGAPRNPDSNQYGGGH